MLELSRAEFVMTRFLFWILPCLILSGLVGTWTVCCSGRQEILEIDSVFCRFAGFSGEHLVGKWYYCVFYEFCKLIGGNL